MQLVSKLQPLGGYLSPLVKLKIRSICMERPPIVIMGLSLTALGVIRSFGKKGIEVIGIDYKRQQISSFSKHCKSLHCPDPEISEDDLLLFMKSLGNKLNIQAVLFPTSDEFVVFVSKNRSDLNSYFKFMLPSHEIVEILNDKRKLYKIAEENGISMPKTFALNGIEDLTKKAEAIQYPCVVKPAFGYLYKHMQFKGIIAATPFDLVDKFKRLNKYADNLVVQEFICGKDDAQYSFAGVFNENSEPLVTFTSRKVRQIPPGFGTGTFVESCVEPAIEKMGISFLRRLNYQGIAEVEFKRDSKDGNIKMIEVNTRIWTQNSLAARCGIDVAYTAYLDIIGEKINRGTQIKQKIRWINFYDDFFACFGSPGYIKKGEITFSSWLKSLICKKEYAVFSFEDIKPFIYHTKRFLVRLIGSILNGMNIRGNQSCPN